MLLSRDIILLSLCFLYVESTSRIDPLVETKVGLIRGLLSSNGQYSMFMGIPFGSVNASNPFGAASKYPNFEQPYEAFDDSASCPQVHASNSSAFGTLDCLRLNIYVPSTASSTNRLPVMVWLYGGGFQRGTATKAATGPDYLIKHDVILVTTNYRLGPYGFMCLDIPDVPGNQGLKDQYMALEWVHDNIEAFGGDINKVLLFGESAGGHSVEFHLRSPNKNLFNKAILESGCAVAATAFVDADKEAPIKLAEYLGRNTSDLHDAIAFLSSLETKKVIDATIALGMTFKPCVEKAFDGVNSFLTTTWVDTQVPKVANMSILLGFNRQERMAVRLSQDDESFKQLDIFKDSLQITFNFSESELVEMEKLVRHFYIGDEAISKDVVWPIIYFDSDFTYIHPLYRSIEKFIESGAGNIYLYMFSYSGGRNFGNIVNNVTGRGAAHQDEMGYLFDMTILPDEPTEADQLVLDRMTTMWTNFAKYSDPTPETTSLLPVKWIPVTADTFHCMKIDSTMSLIRRPLHERMAFWDSFHELNKASLKTYDG